jgi:uncharacterized protein
MYSIVLILLLLISGFLIYKGIIKKKKSLSAGGGILGVLTLLFFWFMNFWGEMLWFRQLGYNERFWILWITKIGLFIAAFLVSGFIVWSLTYSLKREIRYIRYIAVFFGAFLGGALWYSNWDIFLKFINRVPTDVTDPVLNMSTGFYLFEYPFFKSLYNLLLYMSLIGVGASLLGSFTRTGDNEQTYKIREGIPKGHSLFISAGVTLIVLAFGRILSRYGVLFSELGVVNGPGWTDDHIRLPLLTVVAVITFLAGIIMFFPSARKWFQTRLLSKDDNHASFSAFYSIPVYLFLLWFIFLGAVPMLFQWLKVEPNEITVEKPYIENNIEFTRRGFHLNKVEEREFPATEEFSRSDIEKNKNLFSNIRLWDYRALDAVFRQFQEIRLYYEFSDVDIDRYMINNKYREVMISAREMETRNLPVKSQTFINKHFKYTHGYGAVLTKVNEFTPEGLPNLLIKDIPPVSQFPELSITQPAIYYGELTHNYVIANSEEKEFDYPSGEKNIYTRYKGNGGVEISNFWRKVLYGWKYGGTRFLLSGYPTDESRIMFHRQIVERIKTLTPFLYFDDDPYIVNVNGELHWIIDAYTTSEFFPYSEDFTSIENIGYDRGLNQQYLYNIISRYMKGRNYIRNSVKISVNAYNGEVNFYIFEEDDPLIQVYDNMFPGLLKKKSEMPAALFDHVRYPADMLLIQGLMYTKYHMTDPTVFYNQEDLWVRATEKYYNNVQPVEPYYIMWEQPGSDEMEFVLILPFTPKNKQVLIGWIAGMCDDENYGRFLGYKFPKEKRVLGTQQVETKIDQDSYLSGQLTLWDQRGSNVNRGNVLAIPINKTIIYVEPIYLKSETAAYPELRLVAVMHNDRLSYAETFEQALNKLFKKDEDKKQKALPALRGTETIAALIQQANNAFNDYLEYMTQKKFTESADALQKLEQALEQLSEEKKK